MYSSSSTCMSSSESLSCWFSGSSMRRDEDLQKVDDVKRHRFVFQRKLSARDTKGVERARTSPRSRRSLRRRLCASRAFDVISTSSTTPRRRSSTSTACPAAAAPEKSSPDALRVDAVHEGARHEEHRVAGALQLSRTLTQNLQQKATWWPPRRGGRASTCAAQVVRVLAGLQTPVPWAAGAAAADAGGGAHLKLRGDNAEEQQRREMSRAKKKKKCCSSGRSVASSARGVRARRGTCAPRRASLHRGAQRSRGVSRSWTTDAKGRKPTPVGDLRRRRAAVDAGGRLDVARRPQLPPPPREARDGATSGATRSISTLARRPRSRTWWSRDLVAGRSDPPPPRPCAPAAAHCRDGATTSGGHLSTAACGATPRRPLVQDLHERAALRRPPPRGVRARAADERARRVDELARADGRRQQGDRGGPSGRRWQGTRCRPTPARSDAPPVPRGTSALGVRARAGATTTCEYWLDMYERRYGAQVERRRRRCRRTRTASAHQMIEAAVRREREDIRACLERRGDYSAS